MFNTRRYNFANAIQKQHRVSWRIDDHAEDIIRTGKSLTDSQEKKRGEKKSKQKRQ